MMTETESRAYSMQMMEHKAKKCARCCGRSDLKKGGFMCMFGENAKARINSGRNCPKFHLDEDGRRWLD